jgi:hypothetical protein
VPTREQYICGIRERGHQNRTSHCLWYGICRRSDLWVSMTEGSGLRTSQTLTPATFWRLGVLTSLRLYMWLK